MDFEDLLRKAMESEMREDSSDDPEKESFEPGAELNGIISILGMGSMVKLAKAAQAKLTETIRNLTDDLNALRLGEDRAHYCSEAAVKIEKASKVIKILNTIITSNAIMGASSIGGDDLEEAAKKSLDIILRFAMM